MTQNVTNNSAIIVSMATESYNDWIYTFYNSIRTYNKDVKIVIFLVNYDKIKVNLLRAFFPDVTFYEYTGRFIKKPTFNYDGSKECVTHLKGRFVYDIIKKFNYPALWVDITAFIRTDFSEVFDALNNNDVVLNRRDFSRDKGEKVMAAEIFGINTPEVAKYYFEQTEKNSTNWYQDQLSLTELLHIKGIKIYYLKFGDYSNFEYSPKAKTWSDRGRFGKGNLTFDDTQYSFNQFLKELNYNSDDFNHFLDLYNTNKPHIMIYFDADRWCYYNSGMIVAKYLSKYYYITIVRTTSLDKDLIYRFNGDLVWTRCGAYRTVVLRRLRPDLIPKMVTTITTGGIYLDSRVSLHLHHSKGMNNVITQNNETIEKLKNRTNQNIFLIPNGVDIKKFKPQKLHNDFVVGFAGRNSTQSADESKGFTKFLKEPTDELKVKTFITNSEENYIPHEYMYKFYNNIDVLIQVSNSEGCSNTVMEAMSAGIPCIIGKNGYHYELAEHNKNIIIVDRDKEQVKYYINKLMNDKNFYDKISKNARIFAEQHSWDIISQKFKKCFDFILNDQNIYK